MLLTLLLTSAPSNAGTVAADAEYTQFAAAVAPLMGGGIGWVFLAKQTGFTADGPVSFLPTPPIPPGNDVHLSPAATTTEQGISSNPPHFYGCILVVTAKKGVDTSCVRGPGPFTLPQAYEPVALDWDPLMNSGTLVLSQKSPTTGKVLSANVTFTGKDNAPTLVPPMPDATKLKTDPKNPNLGGALGTGKATKFGLDQDKRSYVASNETTAVRGATISGFIRSDFVGGGAILKSAKLGGKTITPSASMTQFVNATTTGRAVEMFCTSKSGLGPLQPKTCYA
jgi:hypothetical protein